MLKIDRKFCFIRILKYKKSICFFFESFNSSGPIKPKEFLIKFEQLNSNPFINEIDPQTKRESITA